MQRDEHVGMSASAVERFGPASCHLPAMLERPFDDPLGLAHHDRVGERRERQRVREGERPAGEHERGALVARLGAAPGCPAARAAHEPGELELVGDAEGDDRKVVERPQSFRSSRADRAGRPAASPPSGRKTRSAATPRHRLDRPVDALVAERAHADGVGRRVGERDARAARPCRCARAPREALVNHSAGRLRQHEQRQSSRAFEIARTRVGKPTRRSI